MTVRTDCSRLSARFLADIKVELGMRGTPANLMHQVADGVVEGPIAGIREHLVSGVATVTHHAHDQTRF